MSKSCICGSNKIFEKCCARFLEQGQIAKTPEQLMRSRYTAYALGGYGEYLLKTWFPVTAQNTNAAELNQRTVDWQRLEVINKSQTGDEGEVEFTAYFLNSNGEEEAMHEVSSFKRINGKWLYVGGVVS